MKQAAPYFLSYARNDTADVGRFRRVLAPLLKNSPEFVFEEWIDQAILPGEHWRTEIEQALKSSRFGLLLVSPEFFASDFIIRNELPLLLAKPMIVPVALQQIAFDGTMDLKGLVDYQVIRDSQRRSFDGCRSMPNRRRFALELFTQIVALLRKHAC